MESRKTFRDWSPKDYAHQPVIPAEILAEDDLVFFLIELVPQLDLTPFYAYYERETRGAPPFDVAMMTTLLVYSYCVGVFSSRKIAAACERNLTFLAIVGHQRPDFRTISDFRKIHLARLEPLFTWNGSRTSSWRCSGSPPRWAWSSSATCRSLARSSVPMRRGTRP